MLVPQSVRDTDADPTCGDDGGCPGDALSTSRSKTEPLE